MSTSRLALPARWGVGGSVVLISIHLYLSILRPHSSIHHVFFLLRPQMPSTIYTGFSSSRCFPRSSSLGSYWAKLSWVGDQRAHSTSFAVLLTCSSWSRALHGLWAFCHSWLLRRTRARSCASGVWVFCGRLWVCRCDLL